MPPPAIGDTSTDPYLHSNGLLRATIYPDRDDYPEYINTVSGDPPAFNDGDGEWYDRVQYTYDRQGEVTSMEDQNETLHTYTYDKLGRQIADTVTLPTGNPQNIDTTVMEIDQGYNVYGNLQYVTSKDGNGAGEGGRV